MESANVNNSESYLPLSSWSIEESCYTVLFDYELKHQHCEHEHTLHSEDDTRRGSNPSTNSERGTHFHFISLPNEIKKLLSEELEDPFFNSVFH
jgi:hypothetical protein